MAESPITRILEELKAAGSTAVKREIDQLIPSRNAIRNPADEEGEEGDEEDEEDEEEGEEVEAEGIVFEDESAETNLACAAAAYRMLGGDGDVIGVHERTGRAFFGTEEDLLEYCETVDLPADEWEVYDDANEILSLDYDQNTMREILKDLKLKDMASSRDQYKGFHWGDESKVTAIKDIPGLVQTDKPLTFLGVAREICYGAKKEGKFQEYYHEHGEESGTFPSLYALGDRTLIIHGGKMRIEDRGIVD